MTHLPAAPSRYLDARVTTASQPELQLMLLDGALRFGQRAKQLWVGEEDRAECDSVLARTLDIAEELVRGAAGGKTEASKRLEEEYAFAFRQLALAQVNHDPAPLDAALNLLAFQRETWKLACEKLKAEGTAVHAAQLAAPPHMPMHAGHSLSLRG